MNHHGAARLLLVALLLTLVLAIPTPARATALAIATPADGPTEFVIQVSGFEPAERASTWLTGPQQQVVAGSQYTINNQGERSFRIRLPRFFEAGRWAVTVQGLSSELQAIAWLFMPALPPDLPLVLAPSRVPAGGSFAVNVAGLKPAETVTYWLTTPDGRALPGSVMIADADGQVAFTHSVSLAAVSGLWSLSVYGDSSDHLGIAFFAVVGPAGANGPAGLRPEQAVASFYAWYLSFPGGALPTGAYRFSPFLTDRLKESIAAAVIATPDVDPIVCANQLPNGVRTDPAVTFVDFARVGVVTDLPNSFVVGLRLVEGTWLMDAIECG